jgi:hypothetical protein
MFSFELDFTDVNDASQSNSKTKFKNENKHTQ